MSTSEYANGTGAEPWIEGQHTLRRQGVWPPAGTENREAAPNGACARPPGNDQPLPPWGHTPRNEGSGRLLPPYLA